MLEFFKAGRRNGAIQISCGREGFLGSYEGEVADSFFWCRAGINIGSVLADGSISACPSLRSDYVQGNINEVGDTINKQEEPTDAVHLMSKAGLR